MGQPRLHKRWHIEVGRISARGFVARHLRPARMRGYAVSFKWVCGSSWGMHESKRNLHLPDPQHPSIGCATGLFEWFRDLDASGSQCICRSNVVRDWTREAQRRQA